MEIDGEETFQESFQSSTLLEKCRKYFEANEERLYNEYLAFLRFPSISTDPEHFDDILACAHWVRQRLIQLGFQVETWQTDTESPPVLFGRCLEAGPELPTLLFYSHYDVQPTDPDSQWQSPPFEPRKAGQEIYARGAQDNKGQCFYLLAAFEFLRHELGNFPVNIKWIIEGEEEVGSHSLNALIEKHEKALRADALLVVDTSMKSLEKPGITLGARGIITMDVVCRGTTVDLHSGGHGGIAYNPIHALVEVLSKLRNASGRVAIPRFYDEVESLSEDELHMIDIEFDERRYLEEFGAPSTGGERNLTPYERAWLRPTIEINGITGGYSGSGFKTVIPAEARAKISCRLVPNQDPDEIGKRVAEFIEGLAPAGTSIGVNIRTGSGRAIRTSPHSRSARILSQAVADVFGKPCSFIFGGGSIPITEKLQRITHAETILMGLGLDSDNIHAPNEHFGWNRIALGMQVIVRATEIFSAPPIQEDVL